MLETYILHKYRCGIRLLNFRLTVLSSDLMNCRWFVFEMKDSIAGALWQLVPMYWEKPMELFLRYGLKAHDNTSLPNKIESMNFYMWWFQHDSFYTDLFIILSTCSSKQVLQM